MSSLSKRDPTFCEWLVDVLDRKRSTKNAYWIDRSEGVFELRWINGRSSAWTPECAQLFKLWHIEGSRSRHRHNTDFNYKDMKTNFRMNLQSEKFVEVTEKPKAKGVGAVRRYKFVKKPARMPRTNMNKPENVKNEIQDNRPSLMTTSRTFVPGNPLPGTGRNHSRTTSMHSTADNIDRGFVTQHMVCKSNCQYDQLLVGTHHAFDPQGGFSPDKCGPTDYGFRNNTTGGLLHWITNSHPMSVTAGKDDSTTENFFLDTLSDVDSLDLELSNIAHEGMQIPGTQLATFSISTDYDRYWNFGDLTSDDQPVFHLLNEGEARSELSHDSTSESTFSDTVWDSEMYTVSAADSESLAGRQSVASSSWSNYGSPDETIDDLEMILRLSESSLNLMNSDFDW